MYQDILPYSYNGDFAVLTPENDDFLLLYEKGKVLIRVSETNEIEYPTIADIKECEVEAAQQQNVVALENGIPCDNASTFDNFEALSKGTYLFKVGEDRYFLYPSENEIIEALERKSFEYKPVGFLRQHSPKHKVFAGIVGMHFFDWYSTRQFCGRCGTPMVAATTERMIRCPECGLMEFPKLFPVVIVAITDGDRILTSKYPHSPADMYALIAGFAEPGETIEETVAREVREEVGLKVKNLKYYKSQPWAFSSSLLFGFFCELDGSDEITLDKNELAWAGWMSREELPVKEENAEYSLTADMMRLFKNGQDAQYR